MRLLAAALALLPLLAPPDRPSPYPSPAETRAEFEAICRQFREGDSPFFGEAQVAELTDLLALARLTPAGAAQRYGELGWHELRLGRLPEAVAHLDQARRLVEETGLGEPARSQLLYFLGLAHLQLGEDANCVARHTAASCIVPLAPDGVHAVPEHARKAAAAFLAYLDIHPEDFRARWLLNLARMLSGEHPDGVPAAWRLPPGALDSAAPFPRWRDVAPDLGVNAIDLSGGAVMDDFDGDGLLDLVSSTWDPCGTMKAFRNDGRGGFADVSAAWGLDAQMGGLNLVHADYDGDGRVDLLVLRGAWLGQDGRIRKSLLRNDLKGPSGRFVDVTAAAGLAYPAYPTQTAAWADYDGDGDLDLYVGNESESGSSTPLALYRDPGRPYPSQLFRNQGDGTFTDVARAAGVTNLRFAKGVAWGDYDNDGDPDLYVSNLGPNRLYRNDGPGSDGGVTFTDVAIDLGVTRPIGSFATWFFDYDNDGDLDLFVNDYSTPVAEVAASLFGRPAAAGNPVLYRNDGPRFTDVSAEVGLTRPAIPMGANYGDLDNDGYPDLYLGTGSPDFDAQVPNLMYRNDRGRGFEDVTWAGGFGHLQKGHGVAFGDLDNDGDQDLFHQLGGAYPYDAFGNALFENPGTGGQRWLTLRLVGDEANRFGVGARIEVAVREGEGRRTVHALAGSGGSFGGSSLQQEIGLGAADGVETLTVRWPGSGAVQVFTGVAMDRFYELVEGRDQLVPLDLPTFRLGSPKP